MREGWDSNEWIELLSWCDRTFFCSIIGFPEGLGEMFELFKGILAVFILALLLLHLLPMEIILIAGMVLLVVLIVALLLFHLGVQDFQGY